MEGILVLLSLALLLTPIAAIVVAIVSLRKAARLERELRAAQCFLAALEMRLERLAVETRAAHRETPPAPAAAPAPAPEPAAPLAAPVVSSVPPAAIPQPAPAPAPEVRKAPTQPEAPKHASTFAEDPIAFARAAVRKLDFGEVNLMQWWLPRLGGALAVLAAVFFGTYVNRDMPPQLRCLEMAILSLAFIAGGVFLERRRPTFGGIVTVVGCVMAYVTSFAAYAFAPVRVVTDPRTGALLQAGVLAAIVIFGLARRSRAIALAAFLMAWPMIGAMVYTGVGDILLLSAALLVVAGTIMPALGERYVFIPWIATPLGGAALGLLGLRLDIATIPNLPWLFAYVAATALAAPLAQALPKWRVPAPRAFAGTAAAVMGLGAWAYFHSYDPSMTGRAYLTIALACLAGFAVAFGRGRWSNVAVQYAVKASAFLSLWIIAEYSYSARWASLLAQATALAVIARREKSIALAASSIVTALVATAFFMDGFGGAPFLFSFRWFLAAGFPLVLVAVLAGAVEALAGLFSDENATGELSVVVAVLAPLLGIPLFLHEPLIPAHPAASALVFSLVALVLSQVILRSGFTILLSAGTTYVIALALFILRHPDSPATLAGLLAVAAAVAGFAEFSGRVKWDGLRHSLKLAAFASAVFATSAWIATQWTMSEWLMTVLALAGGAFLALSRVRGMNALRLVSLAAPLFVLSSGFDYNLASLLLTPVWLVAVVYFARTDGNRTAEALGAGVAALWLALFSADSARFIAESGDCTIVFWSAVAALSMSGLARQKKLHIAPVLSLLPLATAIGVIVFFPFGGACETPHPWTALLAGVLTGLAVPFFALKMNPDDGWKPLAGGKLLPFLFPLLSWAAFAAGFFADCVPGSFRSALLAAASFFLVAFGFAARERHFRIAGLCTLAVPIVRLFAFDLHDPIHRIVAFGVGGVLTMLLGYLYHPLQNRISRSKDERA